MNRNTRSLLRFLLCFAAAFLLVSCRPENIDKYDEFRFLWFIPVSAESTVIICGLELFIFIVCIIIKYNKHYAGWFSHERRTDIRDKYGNLVGTIGTGEYEHEYVSEEEARAKDDRAARGALRCRVISVILFTWGMIVSWIFPGDSYAFYLFWVPICGFHIYYAMKHFDEINLLLIWEKVILVICVICLFVYGPHV